jgi:hypothetical protein
MGERHHGATTTINALKLAPADYTIKGTPLH